MVTFLGFVAGITVLYILVYRKWNYTKKFVFKSVCIYLSLIVTVFAVLITVWTVREAVEKRKSDMLPSRLFYAERQTDDYADLVTEMEYARDYEPEFEHLWERAEMHQSSFYYQIFAAAAENMPDEEGRYKAYTEKYREILLSLCTEPDYEENIPYGEYFLKQAGLTAAKDEGGKQ